MGEETTVKADGSTEVRTGDMLGHRKVQIETRRWLAERLEPRKYGVRTGVDMTSSDGSMAVDDSLRAARVAAILKAATDPKIQSIVAGAGNNDEKTEALGRALFGEDWDK
jgi:hypothetical protein